VTNLHADIFFIKPETQKMPFLVSVSDFGLTIVRSLESRVLPKVAKALGEMLDVYKKYGWDMRWATDASQAFRDG